MQDKLAIGKFKENTSRAWTVVRREQSNVNVTLTNAYSVLPVHFQRDYPAAINFQLQLQQPSGGLTAVD
jgi:hypothetical protein